MSIKLNVGGTLFESTETTLKKINYFKYLFEDTNLTNNDVPFIDRSPHIFKHVLSFARDDTYNYPLKYKNELDFYDIDYDVSKLYDDTNSIDALNDNILKLSKDVNFIKTSKTCNWYNCNKVKRINGYCYNHSYNCDYITDFDDDDDNTYTFCYSNPVEYINGHNRCKYHIGKNDKYELEN